MWVGNALDPPKCHCSAHSVHQHHMVDKSEAVFDGHDSCQGIAPYSYSFRARAFLFGPYNPLLGKRDLSIRLGSDVITDTLPLNQQQYAAFPHEEWELFQRNRLDTMHFVSKPDSLHLEAHVRAICRTASQRSLYATQQNASQLLVFWSHRHAWRLQIPTCTVQGQPPWLGKVLHAGMIEKRITISRTCKPVDQRRTSQVGGCMSNTYFVPSRRRRRQR